MHMLLKSAVRPLHEPVSLARKHAGAQRVPKASHAIGGLPSQFPPQMAHPVFASAAPPVQETRSALRVSAVEAFGNC